MRRLALVAAGLAVAATTAHAAPVQAWLTTPDQQHLLAPSPVTAAPARSDAVVRVDPARQHQRMAGFGAAITEASAWLMRHLRSTAVASRAPGVPP